ncbi:hypothetical protein S40285_01712 [Stachybotrys chlorohalonatus IBT 40285]|uniref:Chitin-binding type-4 domain-containing protein n=1 Tax=Stachybotrys chlorohalonatus (strain IBT 40285) TaxID=1283841 RepID=A0A084QDV7_STAC4|nr:hypothetical protein S40285_01712 [Stachybotrys chlorohalonata IBT 40285]
MFSKSLTLAGLVSAASAHILMTNPVPFAGSSSSPLEGSGSNYPCQAVSYAADGSVNTYAQGSTQQLAFKGTAVHGGGSCQVSVTTDLEPTVNSVWKVIKSIEGGCPAQDAAGNLGNDANLEVPFKYSFDIPEDLAAGQYVLAWTWFNKIGNREMYMNCAPITVTGSSGSSSALSALPDMFKANIGNGCSTTEGTDVKFPDAGSVVEQLNGATSVFAAPVGSCATGTPNSGGDSPEAPSAADPQPTASAQPTVPGGVFVTADPSTATSTASAAPTAAPEQPVEEQPVEEEPVVDEPVEEEPIAEEPVEEPVVETPVDAPAPPVESPAETPSGSQTPGSACSTEGYWNCVGGTAFQRCASGVWSPVQQVAAGTSCTAGIGANINFVKRTGGFTHLARHHAMHRSRHAMH